MEFHFENVKWADELVKFAFTFVGTLLGAWLGFRIAARNRKLELITRERYRAFEALTMQLYSFKAWLARFEREYLPALPSGQTRSVVDITVLPDMLKAVTDWQEKLYSGIGYFVLSEYPSSNAYLKLLEDVATLNTLLKTNGKALDRETLLQRVRNVHAGIHDVVNVMFKEQHLAELEQGSPRARLIDAYGAYALTYNAVRAEPGSF